MSDTSIIASYRELLSVSIACALRWGLASIGILLYWVWLTLYGKNILDVAQALVGGSHPGP